MRHRNVMNAYTLWLLADLRYQRARDESLRNPPTGEAKERVANDLASLAKRVKEAQDAHIAAIAKARDEEAGFF